MKIVSWNVNGLLACIGKGGFVPIAGMLTMSLREPLSIRRGLGVPELDQEGRLLTLEFPSFYLANA